MQLWSFVDRFIQERRILKGVSSATLDWYKYSLQAFEPVLQQEYSSAAQLKTAIITRIEQLQKQGRGNKAVSINTYLRCLKAFLRWCHEEGIVKELVKLSWLKEEQKILPTLNAAAVRALCGFKPRTFSQRRLHALVCLLLDTGLRIDEALSLPKEGIDFHNLIIRVVGKGGKHRLVPFSQELSRILWRYFKANAIGPRLAFPTKNGTKVSQRALLREFKDLGDALSITGVRMSPHTFRHTFAASYLRNGGNLFYLQRILGHSSIETTQRYLQSLGIEDLQAVHNRLSLLAR